MDELDGEAATQTYLARMMVPPKYTPGPAALGTFQIMLADAHRRHAGQAG